MNKKLYRSKDDRMIAGVCGGLANYLGIDSAIMRLLWALSIFISFGGMILAYFIAALVIPEEPAKKKRKASPKKKAKKKTAKKKRKK